MTAEEKRPKQTAFRLPQRTLDILDQIVEEGKARTRTDALIYAIDTYKKTSSQINELKKDIAKMEQSNEYIERKLGDLERKSSEFDLIVTELEKKGLFNR